MATDLERLVVSLEARIDKFNKNMEAADKSFDRRAASIERRNQQLMAKLKNGGADLARTLVPAIGVGSAVGLFHYVEQAVDKIEELGNASRRLGFTAEQLQVLRFAAQHAGMDIETADAGLQKFVQNLGKGANGDKGIIASFKALGVSLADLRSKTPYEVLLKTADGLKGTGNAAQRLQLGLAVGGKSFGKWITALEDGSKGIGEFEASARRLGIVLTNEMVAKGSEAAQKITDLKKVLSTKGDVIAVDLAGPLIKLLDVLEKLAAFVAKHPSLVSTLGLTAIGGALAGPGGAVAGFIASQELAKSKTQDLDAAIKLQEAEFQRLADHRGGLFWSSKDEAAFQLAKSRLDILKATRDSVTFRPGSAKPANPAFEPAKATLGQAESTAYDKAVEQLTKQTAILKGQAGSLDRTTAATEAAAAKERLLAAAKLQGLKVTSALTAEIDRLSAAYGDAAGAAGAQKVLDAGEKRLDQLRTELGTLGLTRAEAEARAFKEDAINAILRERPTITASELARIAEQAKAVEMLSQQIDDTSRALQDQLSLQDEARSGLIEVGAAGVTSFKDIGSALTSLANQLVQTILQLYVMKPLVESLLGQQGTTGGGLVGSLAGSLFGTGGGSSPATTGAGAISSRRFARGGVANEASIFGESGPEAAVPLPDGRSIPVNLRMPRIAWPAPGAARGEVNVSVQTINNSPARVETQTQRQPDGSVLVKQLISEVRKDMAQGGFDPVMRGRFGAAPTRVNR